MATNSRNEATVGKLVLAPIKQLALEKIGATTSTLKNVTLDQRQMLDRAAESLQKSKKEEKGAEPQLPADDADIEPLKALLGESEITLPGILDWCKDKGVPTRLALKEVDQPVFVWDLARQIAEKPDDGEARERLVQVAKGNNRTIVRLALDVLDRLDNMTSSEAQDAVLIGLDDPV